MPYKYSNYSYWMRESRDGSSRLQGVRDGCDEGEGIDSGNLMLKNNGTPFIESASNR